MNYGFEMPVDNGAGGQDRFGLNKARMTKFEYVEKDDTEGYISMEFSVEGFQNPMFYNKFPVNKAFYKEEGSNEQLETDDPNHPAFKEEIKKFNQLMSQILLCYVNQETLVRAFQTPIQSFVHYVQICKGLLPTNFTDIDLDIFLQYQWRPSQGQTRTFLQVPKDLKHGKFLVKSVAPVGGDWKPVPTDNGGLQYVDGAGNVHPFKRSKWFVDSAFGKPMDASKPNTMLPPTASPIAPPNAGGVPTPPFDTTGGW